MVIKKFRDGKKLADFKEVLELVLFQRYNSLMEYGSREWLHVKAEVSELESVIDPIELVSK